MCEQQSLRSACAYAQSDQSLCHSLEYSMSVKLLTEYHLEFLSLKGGCRGSSESTHVKMPDCWKSHATAHFRRGKTGRWGKGSSHPDRLRGHTKQNSKKLNPVGPDGKVLTCRCCGSYRHFVAHCPHNMDESKCETDSRDELIQL